MGDFIIFGEERQAEVYGKDLAPSRNMTRLSCNIQNSFGWLS